jgi:hypothetical protein
LPQPGVPRDEQSIPASAFGRLNHFLAVAYQVLSMNPRLLVFAGLVVIVNLMLVWISITSAAENVGSEPTTSGPELSPLLVLLLVQSLVLHVLQCGLLVGALASIRAEPVSVGYALRVAFSRIVPLAALAFLAVLVPFATQWVTDSLYEMDAGIVSLPFILLSLGWFTVDFMAVTLVADTRGSVVGYLAGAFRLIGRARVDMLILLLLFLVTTKILVPMLVGEFVPGAGAENPDIQTRLGVWLTFFLVHDLVLAVVFVYGARLYIYAVTTR